MASCNLIQYRLESTACLEDYLDLRRQQKSVPNAGALVFSAACECDAADAALLAEHKPRLNCLVAEGANVVKK